MEKKEKRGCLGSQQRKENVSRWKKKKTNPKKPSTYIQKRNFPVYLLKQGAVGQGSEDGR